MTPEERDAIGHIRRAVLSCGPAAMDWLAALDGLIDGRDAAIKEAVAEERLRLSRLVAAGMPWKEVACLECRAEGHGDPWPCVACLAAWADRAIVQAVAAERQMVAGELERLRALERRLIEVLGLSLPPDARGLDWTAFEQWAARIAAAEREACLAELEHPEASPEEVDAARRIRARGGPPAPGA